MTEPLTMSRAHLAPRCSNLSLISVHQPLPHGDILLPPFPTTNPVPQSVSHNVHLSHSHVHTLSPTPNRTPPKDLVPLPIPHPTPRNPLPPLQIRSGLPPSQTKSMPQLPTHLLFPHSHPLNPACLSRIQRYWVGALFAGI